MKNRLFLSVVAAVFLIRPTEFLSVAENAGVGEPVTYEQLQNNTTHAIE